MRGISERDSGSRGTRASFPCSSPGDFFPSPGGRRGRSHRGRRFPAASEGSGAGRRLPRPSVDVASAADVARLLAEVEHRLGGLDVLVANAGVIAAAPVATMDETQWDRIFAVNVKGVFLCARAAIPLLVKRGVGRIVNVASVAGKTGRAGLAAYCASKAAVVSFTQALAEELGPANVAVNALCPGYIQPAMWTEVLNPVLASLFDLP